MKDNFPFNRNNICSSGQLIQRACSNWVCPLNIDESTNKIITKFYDEVVGPFRTERKYLGEEYWTITFPFREIQSTQLYNIYD